MQGLNPFIWLNAAQKASTGQLIWKNEKCGGLQSRQNPAHHFPKNIGEPKVATTVAVGEAFVIEAEEMQEGGVQIVEMHLVNFGGLARRIGGSVAQPSFDAATGHPHRESHMIVIASGVFV